MTKKIFFCWKIEKSCFFTFVKVEKTGIFMDKKFEKPIFKPKIILFFMRKKKTDCTANALGMGVEVKTPKKHKINDKKLLKIEKKLE